MSSKGVTCSPKTRLCAFGPASLAISAAFLFSASAGPVAAQDDAGVTVGEQTDASAAPQQDAAPEVEAEVEAPQPPRERINLSVTVPRDPADQQIIEDCEEQEDAARITNEIIVCRRIGEASDGSWNREEWERDYAARTQGGRTPDTFGIPNHGNPIAIGSVPPPALIIDVEALPQAPEGSDADRIARGLPPLGRDPDPTPEEIAERRRALGLDAPPVPE